MLTYAGVCSSSMLTYGDVWCMQVRFPKNENVAILIECVCVCVCVQVRFPKNEDVAILIERMALYVSKHGHEFERAIINREKVSIRQHTSA